MCCGVSSSSYAQSDYVIPAETVESVRGMALGSGVRASAASAHALSVHPANLAQGGLYHLSSQVGYNAAQRRTTVGGSVVDSMTSKLAAGLSARAFFGDGPAGEHSGWEGRLGLGIPVTEAVRLGIAGRFSKFTITDDGAVPRVNEASPDDPAEEAVQLRAYDIKAFSLDASIGLQLTEGLQLAALGYNLVKTDSPLAPQQVGGSLSFGGTSFALGGDVLVDLTTFDKAKLLAGGGAEYFAQDTFPLRVGYQFDQGRKHHFVTGGLGYVDQRFAVQAALRQRLGSASETRLMFALQYSVR